MICQYCGAKLFKVLLPDGKLVEIADERIWIYGPKPEHYEVA